MSDTFYTKVGRRYIPAKYYNDKLRDSFAPGSTLVTVNGNATSYRAVKVDHADLPVLGALTVFGNLLVDEMIKASISSSQELSPEFRKELNELLAKHNHQGSLFYESTFQRVRNATRAFETQVTEKFEHPAVKESYENFMTIYKLTHQETEE